MARWFFGYVAGLVVCERIERSAPLCIVVEEEPSDGEGAISSFNVRPFCGVLLLRKRSNVRTWPLVNHHTTPRYSPCLPNRQIRPPHPLCCFMVQKQDTFPVCISSRPQIRSTFPLVPLPFGLLCRPVTYTKVTTTVKMEVLTFPHAPSPSTTSFLFTYRSKTVSDVTGIRISSFHLSVGGFRRSLAQNSPVSLRPLLFLAGRTAPALVPAVSL
jgi:hypothetical protein